MFSATVAEGTDIYIYIYIYIYIHTHTVGTIRLSS